MSCHMLTNFGHRVADVCIRIKEMVVLVGVPLVESRQFLRYGLEEPDDDPNRGRLHVCAELINGGSILDKPFSSIRDS